MELPRDLADVPGPSPEEERSTAEVLREQALSQEEVRKFNRDGFVATALPGDQRSAQAASALRAEEGWRLPWTRRTRKLTFFTSFTTTSSAGSGQVLFHSLGHWRVEPRVLEPALQRHHRACRHAGLQGRSVRFWHDQARVKPGGRRRLRPERHQDFSYWDRTGPMAHLTAHIALDDQTLENGALHWVPGSHRWTRDGGPLPQASTWSRAKRWRRRRRRAAARISDAALELHDRDGCLARQRAQRRRARAVGGAAAGNGAAQGGSSTPSITR